MLPPPDVVGIEADRAKLRHAIVHGLRSEVAAQLAGLLNGVRSALVLLAEHDKVEALGADADRQSPEVPMNGKLPFPVEVERHDERVLAVCVNSWHKKATILSLVVRTVAIR